MQARSSHHLTAILQAVNDNEATYQYRHYDNAIHVVQRKHQHLFLQHHLVYSKVGRKHMQLEYGNECRFAPSHSFIFKQAMQISNLPVYKLCQIVTMQPMWCMGKKSSALNN